MIKSDKVTLGILAHVDAGKTTLSESILYKTGVLRAPGRVDRGDAFLDTYRLEQQRGITIFSKQAVFPLQGKTVTLLDTPGHMDFSAEMERTLQVLDYAVLIISGADGMQGQVKTIWSLLERYGVPVFLFINKMDLESADLDRTISLLQKELNESCISFDKEGEELWEKAALCDERLLDQYLQQGNLDTTAVAESIAARKIFPVYSGSALKMEGIDRFLEGIARYGNPPSYPDSFGARVFKITRDEKGNRLTHLKVTGGTLRVRDTVGDEKISQIRIYSGSRFETAEQVSAGTVCAVTGLASSRCGQSLGAEPEMKKTILDTVITYQAVLPEGENLHGVYEKFCLIEEEIPELHVLWDEVGEKINVQLMGEIQGEILSELMAERFGLCVQWGSGTILYKETIAERVEGVGHFEPLRHYAEVHLLMEPLPAGSGLMFDTVCSEDLLDRNWQRLILTHLAEKEHIGVLTGSPITDMRITLVSGKAHEKHTEGGDFRQATYRAVRNGLCQANSVLLEPCYSFRLEVPSAAVGRAIHDIQRMHGTADPPETFAETAVLTGRAPVCEMNGYQREVLSYTKGEGRLSCVFQGYFPCHNAEEVIEASGYDADGDLENPAGSIFCRNGAGTAVPWDEVKHYMHLESYLKAEPKENPEERTRRSGSSVSDEELEAIFRQTYGISKRENNRFKRSQRIISADSGAGRIKVDSGYNDSRSRQVLLVDGYNMIFAWDELKDMAESSLENARKMLIEILANYQGYYGTEIIIVFDAYKQPGNAGTTEKYGDLSVIYTREGQTADQYIEKFVLENVKKLHLTVATSDGLEQLMVFGQGALRMPARELCERINAANQEIREKYIGKPIT